MIIIEEKTPIKLSGLTSLHIKLDYKPEIINIIKNAGNALWHKKQSIWECPLTSLSFLLDNLTYLDDIELRLQPDKESGSEGLKTTLKAELKSKLFDHQVEAVNYGLQEAHTKWLLMDDMGMGKSLEAIALAEELRETKGLKHCLIICGIASLRANWEKEIKTHSYSSYITIGKNINSKGNVVWSTIPGRAAQLKNKIDEFYVIINVESLIKDEIVDAILNSENEFDMIIVDEFHKVSNKQSQRGANLLKLTKSKYRLGLSGTPVINSPINCFLPLSWIGVDHSTLTNFKAQYCKFGGFGGHEIVGYQNIDLLKDELESCSLRRTKSAFELPPKTIIDEVIEMNDTHRKFYENVKKGIREECDKIILNTQNLLALTTRLRQAATCPSLLTTNEVTSSKLERCVELVEDIVEQGDKVVIMSSFKEPVYQLERLLTEYKPLVCTGDIKDDVVANNVEMFQKDDEHKVIICTSQRAGTGITLNRAAYMIVLDEPFTAALYNQMTDRIYRITNKHPVFIYNIICEHTIDERVAEIINKKKALSDFMIDDKEDLETMEILKKYIMDL